LFIWLEWREKGRCERMLARWQKVMHAMCRCCDMSPHNPIGISESLVERLEGIRSGARDNEEIRM
jgi:hypothetical protein